MIAYCHAHARVVGVVFACAVDDHAVDCEHSTCWHRYGKCLAQNIVCPFCIVNRCGGAGEVMRSGNDTGASIFEGGFFEVKDDGVDVARPLSDIAMEICAFVVRCCAQGGVVVAVGEDFDIGSQKRFEWVERVWMRDCFSKDRRAVHKGRDAHGAAILIAHDGFDFAVNVFHNSRFQVFNHFFWQKVWKTEKTVVSEELDLSHGE